MHISDVRKFLRCPRLYQYSLKDNQKSFPYFNINVSIDDSIVNKLRIDNYYLGRVNEDNDNTAEALIEHEWLLKARFTYRGLRCRVPYLYHKDSHCDLYFSSYSVNPTDGEADNIMWTAAVVEKNGLTVDNIYIISRIRNTKDRENWITKPYGTSQITSSTATDIRQSIS